jgi:hypothetical protein
MLLLVEDTSRQRAEVSRRREIVLLRIAGAPFDALRQLLVLKNDLCQMLSDRVRRCILRELAHTGSLPTVILAGHLWFVERRNL